MHHSLHNSTTVINIDDKKCFLSKKFKSYEPQTGEL